MKLNSYFASLVKRNRIVSRTQSIITKDLLSNSLTCLLLNTCLVLHVRQHVVFQMFRTQGSLLVSNDIYILNVGFLTQWGFYRREERVVSLECRISMWSQVESAIDTKRRTPLMRYKVLEIVHLMFVVQNEVGQTSFRFISVLNEWWAVN